MKGPSIIFDSVGLNLGNTQILEDISFSIEAGSIHCIIGANGGGKTSLVRSMLGQMPHTGRIEINWAESQTIGYVPQYLDFEKTIPVTVYDFLTMAIQRRPVFLGQSRQQRQVIDQVLEKFGLSEKRHSKLGSLSGGERQRAIFAQAFIPEPALLVLDEPMTGLDVTGAEILLSVVEDFAAWGGTVVWINHDIAQVNEVADQLTYVNKSIRLDGKPNEVLQSAPARELFPTLHFEQADTGIKSSEPGQSTQTAEGQH